MAAVAHSKSPLELARMSLAIQQLIETYEEQVATTGNTPRLEMELNRLYAQRETTAVGKAKAAEAEAAAEVAAETKAAKKVKAVPVQQEGGKEIVCRACQEPFFMTENQSNFFRSLNLAEPKTCQDCRAAKKASRLMLPCQECEGEFEHKPADQAFYAKQGWGQPKRCAECRKAKKAAVLSPQTLSCGECKRDFNFSVVTQKFFAEKGWKPPMRCHFCREAKKALKNVVPAEESRAFAASLAEAARVMVNGDGTYNVDDAEALRVVEEAFASTKPVEFGFALPDPAPAIFRGSSASAAPE